MTDILEVIKSRRNVEEFEARPVSWDKISRIIDAGRHAPSSGNLQNWKFLVIRDMGNKQRVSDIAHQQHEIANAFCLIIVCGETAKAERYYGMRGVKLYTVQNCAAAIQNMLLEAHSLGLGGRWIGAFDEQQLQDAFGMPADVRPQAILAIGHPKHVPEKPPKYPLEGQIYLEAWGSNIEDFTDWYYKIPAAHLERNLKQLKEDGKSATKTVGKALGLDTLHKNIKEKVKKSFKKKRRQK